jgi:hypothetical protein
VVGEIRSVPLQRHRGRRLGVGLIAKVIGELNLHRPLHQPLGVANCVVAPQVVHILDGGLSATGMGVLH